LLAAGQKAPARRDMVLHGGGEQNDASDNQCAAAPVIVRREAQGCGHCPDHHAAQDSKR